MGEIAITVEHLGKRYLIQQGRAGRAGNLTDMLAGLLSAPARALRGGKAAEARSGGDEIWALQDISFSVRHGEVVGIIGRNGAGKSTLLKVLSRITEPTTGRIELHGRVGSLLEVGTGFHADLTGRENIYLSGALLGMKRAEIARKFDEIVAFAEVERFIDTPVKRYSSGMYVRLAFAVAAHLEPEILIVDEVLAVGDLRFQKKCLSKMQDVGQQGRTVLFVSHSMQTITRLCRRAILLDQGSVVQDGSSLQVVAAYLNGGFGISAARVWDNPATAPRGDVVQLRAIAVRAGNGTVSESVDIGDEVWIELEYDVFDGGSVLMPFFHLHNEEGIQLFSAHDRDPAWRRRPRPEGTYRSTVCIPPHLLSEGTILVSAGVTALEPVRYECYERDAVAFQVVEHAGEHGVRSDGARGDWTGEMGGVMRPLLDWQTEGPYVPQPAEVRA